MAGPLDDQRHVEHAMKAALPSEAICERGGNYKAACRYTQQSPEQFSASVVLTNENHILFVLPFDGRFVEDPLQKFYESMGVEYSYGKLISCWSNSLGRRIDRLPNTWVTPQLITVCDLNGSTLKLEIYANNRF